MKKIKISICERGDDVGGIAILFIVVTLITLGVSGMMLGCSSRSLNVKYQGLITAESHEDIIDRGSWYRVYDFQLNDTMNMTIKIAMHSTEHVWSVGEYIYLASFSDSSELKIYDSISLELTMNETAKNDSTWFLASCVTFWIFVIMVILFTIVCLGLKYEIVIDVTSPVQAEKPYHG